MQLDGRRIFFSVKVLSLCFSYWRVFVWVVWYNGGMTGDLWAIPLEYLWIFLCSWASSWCVGALVRYWC